LLYKQSNVEHESIVTGFRQKVYKYVQHSNTYKEKKKNIQKNIQKNPWESHVLSKALCASKKHAYTRALFSRAN